MGPGLCYKGTVQGYLMKRCVDLYLAGDLNVSGVFFVVCSLKSWHSREMGDGTRPSCNACCRDPGALICSKHTRILFGVELLVQKGMTGDERKSTEHKKTHCKDQVTVVCTQTKVFSWRLASPIQVDCIKPKAISLFPPLPDL